MSLLAKTAQNTGREVILDAAGRAVATGALPAEPSAVSSEVPPTG